MFDEIGQITGGISAIGSIGGSIQTNNRGEIGGGIYVPTIVPIAENDYEKLINKPSIEKVELIGDKSFEDLGLSSIGVDDLLEILT